MIFYINIMLFPWLTQSYWRDEAFTVLLAQHSFVDILKLSAQDFSPPLYTLILKLWMYVFGVSEIATRSLSMVFYILTVGIMVVMMRKVFVVSRINAMILTIPLALISPILSYYAFETRMYAMLACIATASWYFFLRKQTRFHLLMTIIGLYTHYFMILIIVTQLICSTFSWFRCKRKSRFSIPPNFIYAFIAFVPWLLLVTLFHQAKASEAFWISKPDVYQLFTIPGMLVTGFEKAFSFYYNLWPITYVVMGLIGFGLLVCYQSARIVNTDKKADWFEDNDTRHFVALCLWAFVPSVVIWIGSQLSTPLFLPRYLIVSAPALILLIALSLSHFRILFKVAGLVIIVFLLWRYQVLQIIFRTKEDMRGKIYAIRKTASPTDYLIVESELDYHIAQIYWFSKDNVRITKVKYIDIPSYVGKSLIPSSAVITPDQAKRLTGYTLNQAHQATPIIW